MKVSGWLLLLACVSGCCPWGGDIEDYGRDEWPEYTGPRDLRTLEKIITERHAWTGFIADADARAHDPGEDKTYSFSVELIVDREAKAIMMSGTKNLAGSLFLFESVPGRHIFEDHMADPSETFELTPASRFRLLADLSVADIRRALLDSWPPAGRLVVNGPEMTWGDWTFDTRSLAPVSLSRGGWSWNFGHWEAGTPFWTPGLWRFRSGGAWMQLEFDVEELDYSWRWGD